MVRTIGAGASSRVAIRRSFAMGAEVVVPMRLALCWSWGKIEQKPADADGPRLAKREGGRNGSPKSCSPSVHGRGPLPAEENMSKLALGIFAIAAIAGCGGSFPAPSQRLSSAEAASRSARELGAEKEPKAALYLKYANEQIERSKGLIAAGDNRGADETLARANADAELALQLAKETTTRAEANEALEKLKALKGGK
jgi:hypothetical protein